MAAPTVRLQVSDYSQLSDYNSTKWLVKNKAATAPDTFEEIVLIMIKFEIKKMHIALMRIFVFSAHPYSEKEILRDTSFQI